MRPGWIGRVLVAMVAMVATWAPSARACSCMHDPASRDVVPPDGSKGWPLDAAVWVILGGAWPRTAAAAMAQDYRLREPDGDVVLLVGEADGFLLSLRPVRRLTPDTTYTIERLYTYGDGTLLTDDQLVALLEDDWPRQERPPTDVVRAWFPEQTFRTGESDAPRVGASPRVTAARYRVDANSSCGPSESLTVEGEVAAGVAGGTTIGVEVQGQGVVWRIPVGAGPAAEEPARWTASTSDSLCAPQKVHVDVTAPVRVRAVVWRPDGRREGASDWTEASRVVEGPRARATPVAGHSVRTRHWSRMRRWAAVVAARAALWRFPLVDGVPIPGPAGCAGGLLPTGEPDVRSPWIWRRGPPRHAAGRWWVEGATSQEGDASAVALDVTPGSEQLAPFPLGRASRYAPVADDVGADHAPIALDLDAPFIVLEPADVTVPGEEPAVRVRRPTRDGTPRWERTFRRADEVVAGGGRVLVRGRDQRGDGSTHITAWTLLDADTGEVVATGELGETTRDGVIVWDGAAFVLGHAWHAGDTRGHGSGTGPDGTWLTLLDRDGAVTRLPMPDDRPPGHVVRTTDGWVVATGGTVTWIDRAGAVTAGPWTIPRAVLPSVTDLAVRGDLAFLAGNGMMEPSGYAVVDRDGHLSAPFRPPGAHDLTLAVVGDTLLAAYGLLEADPDRPGWGRSVAAVQPLTCLAVPSTGAPPRIERPN